MESMGGSLSGAGGPILVILAILSFVSVMTIFAKALALRSVLRGRARRAEALGLLLEGDYAGAEARLGPVETAADNIARTGIARLASGRRAGLEHALVADGNAASAEFFRHIRLLETIAMISPLLGLLGTVFGMIQAFRDLEMAEGSANAALLAGGIWQALLTTAAGLAVALPAAAAAALLAARAEAATAEIEGIIGRLLSMSAEDSGRS